MAIALDTNANATAFVNDTANDNDVVLPAMSTDAAATLVYIIIMMNDTATVSSITGGGLTFTQRTIGGGVNKIEAWSAPASSQLSAVQFTVTLSGSTTFKSCSGFAIAGHNTSSTFDGNASIPANGTTSAISISTDNADDLLIGGYRFSSQSTPTAGSGWTQIHGSDFLLTEYKVVSATQSGTTVAIGTGDTDENGGVADAVKASSGSTSWGRLIGGEINRLVLA